MSSQNTFIVVGLGYGDEGKGSWVDYLVREYGVGYVIRFNGGSQASHQVVSPDGVTHLFSQFGSGTLVPGTKTCLSHYVLVNPISLLREADVLKEKGVIDVLDRILVDGNCLVITHFNSLLNKILEISRGDGRHGSCGCGIGLTQEDAEQLGDKALYIKDLEDVKTCRRKLDFLWKLKLEKAEEIAEEHPEYEKECEDFLTKLKNIDIDLILEIYSEFIDKVKVVDTSEILEIIRENSVVFEGAQGVLLDEEFGFYPHTTNSRTTFENAVSLLKRAGFKGPVVKIGLLRGYSTRHGAGPFVTEDSGLVLEPCHNHTGPWQGVFRLGWFDCVTARYALSVTGGVDILALTNLDRMSGLDKIKICNSYQTGSGGHELNIKDIRPVGGDLQKLTERTSFLNKCRPVYTELPGWTDCDSVNMEGYLKAIGQFAGQQIGAISISPTALGKCERVCCSVV